MISTSMPMNLHFYGNRILIISIKKLVQSSYYQSELVFILEHDIIITELQDLSILEYQDAKLLLILIHQFSL